MSYPYPQPKPQPPVPTAPPKSPGVAAILSLIIPGLGHLYTGNPLSALFWFILAAVGWWTLALAVGFVILPIAWLGAIIHAYSDAQSFNRRHHAVR